MASPVVRRALGIARRAGYSVANLASDADLEVYFDVFLGSDDIGYVSRGWNDPGFRLSNQLVVSGLFEESMYSVATREFCATNGVALSWAAEGDGTSFMLETVLYDSGFNCATLKRSFEALTACRREVLGVAMLLATQALFATDPTP